MLGPVLAAWDFTKQGHDGKWVRALQADYMNVGITVKCAGLLTVTPKAPPADGQKALGSKPLISDEEMQEQYRQLYSDAKVERAIHEQHVNKVRALACPDPAPPSLP